jgi:chromosomal replication initiation ATPase DnaA
MIMKTVAAKFNIRISDLKSHKNKNLVIPRQIAMYLARKLTLLLPDIGAKIGGKDHSTVIYANNKSGIFERIRRSRRQSGRSRKLSTEADSAHEL